MKTYLNLAFIILSLNLLSAQEPTAANPPATEAPPVAQAVKLPEDFEAIQKQLIDSKNPEGRYTALIKLAKSVPEMRNIRIADASSLATALANEKLTAFESGKLIEMFSNNAASMRPEERDKTRVPVFTSLPAYQQYVPAPEDMTNLIKALKQLSQSIVELQNRMDALEKKEVQK